MSDSTGARRALSDLESRLRAAGAPILEGFRPGLRRDQVLERLGSMGTAADPALVALYSWHDGAAGGGSPAELLDAARFLSLEEAIATRDLELRLASENEFLPDFPAAAIFDPGWFPILQDPSGRVYVVEDFGQGRVLLVDRMETGNPEELGHTLIDFLDSIAQNGLDFNPPPLSADAAVLVSRLESTDARERTSAVRELTRKRPGAAFEPLVAMLQSEDPQARRTAALLLGELGDPRAVPFLIRCVATWSGVDVTSARAGLAAIGKAGDLAHLENALVDRDPDLRLYAIQGLLVTRDARAVPALQAAASGDADPRVRAGAAEALRALGEPR